MKWVWLIVKIAVVVALLAWGVSTYLHTGNSTSGCSTDQVSGYAGPGCDK